MGGYQGVGNNTSACDSQTCQISCSSGRSNSVFGNNVCFEVQQNFLDGTPCGGGGKCDNVSLLRGGRNKKHYLTKCIGTLQRHEYRRRDPLMDRRPQGYSNWSVCWGRRSSTLRHFWMLCSPLQERSSEACKDAVTTTWLGHSDATYAAKPILPTTAATIWAGRIWKSICTASANVYSGSEVRISSRWTGVSSEPVTDLEFWDVYLYFVILRTVHTQQVLHSPACLELFSQQYNMLR